MTIAITLNNVHQTNGRRTLLPPDLPSRATHWKARPHRKLQQHRATIDNYRPQQILSNGYAVIPMLSLRDATRMLQERNQAYGPEYDDFQRHSSALPSQGSFQFPPRSNSRLPSWNDFANYDMMRSGSTLYSATTPLSSLQPPPLVSDDDSSSYDRSVPPSKNLQPTERKKSVRFAPTATLYQKAVSEEDLRNSWYSVAHYVAFEAENRRIVNSVYCSKSPFPRNSSDESIELLGLEQFLQGPEHMMQRRNRSLQHGCMVLEIYDMQRSLGQYSPELVRRVSERWSHSFVQSARQRAMGK